MYAVCNALPALSSSGLFSVQAMASSSSKEAEVPTNECQEDKTEAPVASSADQEVPEDSTVYLGCKLKCVLVTTWGLFVLSFFVL